MRYAFLLPLLALAGCTVGPSLHDRMAAYIGASEQQLVQSLGVPDKQITTNGITYLAYDRRSEEVEGDEFAAPYGPWPWGYGPFYAPVFPQTVYVWSCETTFQLKDGHVVTFTLQGNDCS
jgi:hypothetical protein